MRKLHTEVWKDPISKTEYEVTVGLDKMADHLVFSYVSITSLNGSPITIETYRKVPVVQFVQNARKNITDKPVLATEESGSYRGSALSKTVLQEVARIYKESCNYGVPPIPNIAKAFKISKSTSAKRVMLARKHGFLQKAVRGKAGEKSK